MKARKFHRSPLQRLLAWLAILLGSALLLVWVAYAATNLWPNFGAGAVDLGRRILGDRAVSLVENLVLGMQDNLKQVQYRLLKSTPSAPWQVYTSTPYTQTRTPVPVVQPTKISSAVQTNPPPSASLIPTLESAPILIQTPPAPAGWELKNLAALGRDTPGEGIWEPYLWDPAGKVVAYRTFLVPDPERPYASVAVVAFNLQAARLHFVLGYEEPESTVFITRPARIPASDMLPGKILAAFNGGFKAQHGHFGVMLDGVTLIPPRDGFGTVAIFADGKVALGSWGKDIISSPDMVAWRQNGPLIIQDGHINPHTAVDDPLVWGFTTYGDTATGRSALGISPDGNILYYAVGFDLTLPALARAVQGSGAYQAIQLDINNFYTHFEAFSLGANNRLIAVPLLDQMKGPGDQRYLMINKRDFFYVTAR